MLKRKYFYVRILQKKVIAAKEVNVLKEKGKKEKKKAFRKAIANNLYMVKLSYQAYPPSTVGKIMIYIVQGFVTMFYSIIFLERLMGYMERGADFGEAALFLAVSLLIVGAVHVWEFYYWHYQEVAGVQIIYEKLHLKMFQKAADVELECFENPEFYDKYMKATSQVKGKAFGALNNIGMLAFGLLNVCFLTYKSVATDPWVLLFAILPFVSTYILSVRANRLIYERYEANVPHERKLEYVRRTMYLQDYAKEIRLSGIYHVLMEYFHTSIRNIVRNIKKYGRRAVCVSFSRDSLNYTLTTGCTICYAALRLLYWKNISAADFVVLVSIIIQFTRNFIQISERLSKIQDDSQYIDNLKSFMEYKPKLSESQEGVLPSRSEALRMKNVSYTYFGQDKPVLKGINLSVEPGQKIALVGLNGAGKTTLVKLLMRLYDASEGQITLGGRNIKEYGVRAYRDLFAAVFQDYKMFSMSVAENVMMGNVSEAQRPVVEAALKNSGVWDKVQTLKNGMDAVLTKEFEKEGVVLSGGEAQKVAIARVFVRDCDFVILDEPSSALDPIAEYKMYESMLKACEDKAIIFISHRLSSAVLADKIYMLENGEIIEEGSHKELMEQNGKYADMFRLQAKSYQEEGVE